MREYSKVGPQCWRGETFRALKARGSEGVPVALYLMTAPASTMLGIFSLGIGTIADDTGLPYEGALKGLRDCVEVGFASYDATAGWVWVHEMAAWQIAPALKSGDNRVKGLQRDYEALPDIPFVAAWFLRYGKAFGLTERVAKPVGKPEVGQWIGEAPSQAPPQAPPKPGAGTGAGAERAGTRAGARAERAPAHTRVHEEGPDDGPPPPPPPPADPPPPTAAGLACRAMRAAGFADTNPADPRLQALLAQGVTAEELAGVAAEAVKARPPKGWGWVLATVQGRRTDAAAITVATAPPPDPMAWAESRATVEDMGSRLGLGPYEELDRASGRAIPWQAYRRRVIAAWEQRQQQGASA